MKKNQNSPGENPPLTEEQLSGLAFQVLVHRTTAMKMRDGEIPVDPMTSAETHWMIADKLAEWRDREMGIRKIGIL